MLKRITCLLGALLFIGNMAVAQKSGMKADLAKPIKKAENYKVYGSAFPDDAQFFSPGYLARNSEVFKGQKVATEGTIKQVCQKKGCFFILPAGNENIRVIFKDYEFFVPKNSAGLKVELVGQFKVKELSAKRAKHYAEDAGENPGKVKGAQKKEYNIVATSVKIMDAE